MSEQPTLFETNVNETIQTDTVNNARTLRVVSLFSGCGGMDLGFRGNFSIFNSHYEKNPYEIVFSNDILDHACKTYEHNFKHKPFCGDIKNLDYSILPNNVDVVIGGFPCQDFSVAGKRKGLSSDRGRLYLEMKKVIEHCNPIAFVAENVDGLRTSMSDDTSALEIICKDFESLGYKVIFKPLNACDYGVPQNRVRIIIVGIRNDIHKEMKYPKITYGPQGQNPYRTAKDAIDDLWDKLGKTEIKNHTEKDFSRAKFYPNKRGQGNCQIKADRPSPTIRSEHHGNIEGHYRSLLPNDPNNVDGWRRLSVRECARLQSFPDNFEFPCSASSAYKEIGNAVPPILGWNIARALYNSLFE